MAKDTELAVLLKLHDQFSKQFQRVVKTTDKNAKKMTASIGKMGKAFGSLGKMIGGAIAAYATLATAQKVWGAVQTYAKLEAMRISFRQLAKDVGIAEGAIDRWRSAVRSTIGDVDLLEFANKLLISGLLKTEEQFTAVAKAALLLARATGQEVYPTFQKLVYSITGAAPRALRQIGIDMESIWDVQRKMRGQSLLPLELKQRTMLEALMRKVKEGFTDFAELSTTTSETIQQMRTHWGNVAENIGEAAQKMAWLAEGIAGFAESLSAIVRDIGKLAGAGPNAIEALLKSEKLRMAQKRGGGIVGVWSTLLREFLGRAKLPRTEWTEREGLFEKKEDVDDWVKRLRAASDASWNFEQWQKQVREMTLEDIPIIKETPQVLKDLWGGAATAVEEYSERAANAGQAAYEAVAEGLRATQQVISDVFFDALTGKMKSFKEYMLQFLTDLASALSDFAAKMAMMGLLQLIPKALGALGGALGGGGGMVPVTGKDWTSYPSVPGGGGLMGITSGASSSFGSISGGFTAVKPFQHGGISPARPTPAILGEGGMHEAVVPLPRGRSIPVEFTGGGAGITINPQINFNMYAHDTEGFPRLIQKHRREFEGVVLDAMRKSVHFVREIRGK